MIITEIKDRNEKLVTELVDVWERSVKATHLFLSEAEMRRLKPMCRRLWAALLI